MARFDLVIRDGQKFILEVEGEKEVEHGPFQEMHHALGFIRKRQQQIAEKIGNQPNRQGSRSAGCYRRDGLDCLKREVVQFHQDGPIT